MEDKFKYRVAQVMAGDLPPLERVVVCDTPDLIHSLGFTGDKIVMEQNKLRLCLAPEETQKDGERHHYLPIDFMDNLPHYIQNPAMVLSSLTHPNDSIVLVTDCKDKKEQPIIIALRDEGKRGVVGGEIITYDKLSSAYGREEFADFLERSIIAKGANNGLLYWNEKKSRDLAVRSGLELPGALSSHDSNVIIRRYNENVNPLPQNNLDFSPDGYGATLYRPDKQPFAYSDPDGRQKVYEYTKDRNGKEYLSSTTATFSDGRSEITRYDERGAVVGIERKDVNGRTSYKYSCGWSTVREESYEYFDVKYPHYDIEFDYIKPPYKSVHEKERNREDGRYGYYDKYQETWHEYDGNDNTTLYKHNEYREDGFTSNKYYCEERQHEYDRHGNCTLSIEKDHNGRSVTQMTYYTSEEWFDYYNLTPEDTDGECKYPIKSETYCSVDGSFRKCEYDISGEYTEVEMSADGKLTAYRGKDGVRHVGQAAQHAYRKSVDVLAQSASAIKQSAMTVNRNTKTNNGKPGGNGSGGNGSSGAGR